MPLSGGGRRCFALVACSDCLPYRARLAVLQVLALMLSVYSGSPVRGCPAPLLLPVPRRACARQGSPRCVEGPGRCEEAAAELAFGDGGVEVALPSAEADFQKSGPFRRRP